MAMEVERPQQLWLDVERPILTRPRRPKPTVQDVDRPPSSNQQMELKMATAPKKLKKIIKPPAPPIVRAEPPIAQTPRVAPAMTTPEPTTASAPPQSFGSWLFDQTKRAGMIGELAKAAKLDRLFPKNGSVEDVRARFATVGADGDAFMALEDAENEYDRR
ncbi:hypothetical protein Q4F19_07895 [Sphingomonas sp. BIUV-7]|uniref:Uncharacterized protein n=1 Tax=Sphingomonas natans TaxID=3063330 RepID=A0ABT8Y7K2_9SPHN|nr:hypothetical protein [Sphingomonas sp. BIUV-7]